MNSQHIVDSILSKDYNEAEQTMFESLTQKLNDKIIESKYEVANQFREEMDGGTGYDAFFKKAMKKFGISSPADLKTDEKKKEFFDYIDKNFTAKNEAYGGMGMMRRRGEEEMMDMMRRKEEEEYSEEESGLRRRNPYLPVSTPDDRPPFDPRPVGGRPGPKIVPDPGFPGFPDFSDDPDDIPIGPGGLPGGYPGPKIVPDPGFPGVPPGNIPVEGEMPMMGDEMMGMDKKKKMGKESGDLESAIKKALDVAGKEQAQAPQAEGGMPGMGGGGQMPPMGGGGQNPMAAMAKMMGGGGMKPPMGGGMKPRMGGGMKPPMGGGMKPRMGGGMKPPMGGMKMNRRKMGGGM